MPVLEKIIIKDWRNIVLQELEFCPGINCISGGNGQGKTNLLDAIYYLSMTKSAFSSTDKYNFRKGCPSFEIAGYYGLDADKKTKISVKVEADSQKKLVRDSKAYSRISDHIGLLPVVMVSPSDTALVSEGGDQRRKFFSSVLSQMDPQYLDAMQRYNKLLDSRNALLKSGKASRDVTDVLDMQMEHWAGIAFAARQEFCQKLLPLVQELYMSLSGGAESVGIEYRSDLQKGNLSTILANGFERDLALGYTFAGIQRDDFIFTMDGEPIRKVGSQGQQKSFLVALKFAQYRIMANRYGAAPILLLDDLFDKLDLERTENLLRMVSSSSFGQIFLSDTDKNRLQGILDKITVQSTYYNAHAGEFTKI